MPASRLLVPGLDPVPIPGPAWLFHLLWVATFVLHLLFVNALLGGTLLAAAASFAGKRLRSAAVLFVEMNSWTISLAITFGIAPLLFLQVLQGRFFYSATILVLLAQLSDPLSAPKKARHVTELILGAILLMVVTRHQVRGLYLVASGVQGSAAEAPQWGLFAAFLAAFVLCLGLAIYACVRAWKDRPTDPGAIA